MTVLSQADQSGSFDDPFALETGAADTLVGRSCSMAGDIVCDVPGTTIVIAGKLSGTICSAGRVIIAEGGQVEGSVRASRLAVAGRIARRTEEDGVVVDGELALARGASLECSAVYETLRAERGAVLAGVIVPFSSSLFHELYATGRLAFVDLLQLSPLPASESSMDEVQEGVLGVHHGTHEPRGAGDAIPLRRGFAHMGGEARPLRALRMAQAEGGLTLVPGTTES